MRTKRLLGTGRRALRLDQTSLVAHSLPVKTRVPGEWEAHAGCWLAWPEHPDWGADLPLVQTEWLQFAKALEDANESLRVVLPSDRTETDPRLDGLREATFHPLEYGDIWLRDTGPVLALDADGAREAQCFQFNGWGKKFEYPGDADLAPRLADLLGAPHQHHDIVLEGGAVETDGNHLAITTRACLMDPKRNPGRTAGDLERAIQRAYGVDQVIWLERGLANDHTDGHVDTLARFIQPGVVAWMEPATEDPNREVLIEIRDALTHAKPPLSLVAIPSPGPVTDARGALLPASYLNFFIANEAVLVPTYGVAADDAACTALQACFSDRPVVGLSARALLGGGGAFHCITQQIPKDSSDA